MTFFFKNIVWESETMLRRVWRAALCCGGRELEEPLLEPARGAADAESILKSMLDDSDELRRIEAGVLASVQEQHRIAELRARDAERRARALEEKLNFASSAPIGIALNARVLDLGQADATEAIGRAKHRRLRYDPDPEMIPHGGRSTGGARKRSDIEREAALVRGGAGFLAKAAEVDI